MEVVPGVPAVTASAALLGAPLSHDFCCISLSDRLTPWELDPEKRLALAAEADFVIALYNPKSRGRGWQFPEACGIVGEHPFAGDPCGYRLQGHASRPAQGQRVQLTWLSEAADAEVDMQTLVIIGVVFNRVLRPFGGLGEIGQ